MQDRPAAVALLADTSGMMDRRYSYRKRPRRSRRPPRTTPHVNSAKLPGSGTGAGFPLSGLTVSEVVRTAVTASVPLSRAPKEVFSFCFYSLEPSLGRLETASVIKTKQKCVEAEFLDAHDVSSKAGPKLFGELFACVLWPHREIWRKVSTLLSSDRSDVLRTPSSV